MTGDAALKFPEIALKRFLSIFSDRIFDSSVDRGMPNLAAAPVGPEHAPATFFQRRLNHVLLLCDEFSRELNLVFRFWCQRRLLRQPAFVNRENLRFAKYHRTLDDVLQFAYVSGPRIGLQQFQRLLVDTSYVLTGFSRVAIDKVFNQQRNVLASFAKRRNLDRENIQAVKQIAAERPSADGSLQVTVRGCDDPNVSADRTSAADAFKFVLLQNTQQGHLSLGRKISDFVEEERASICQFKPTQALLSGAGEGPLLMAEQLRSDQVTRDCRAVHAHECARASVRSSVDGARNKLFAGSRFARDENGRVTSARPWRCARARFSKRETFQQSLRTSRLCRFLREEQCFRC